MNELKYGNTFVCTSIRLFEHLRREGYMPFRITYNFKDPVKLVWLFENSVELERTAEDFRATLNK